jgi:hypothetical protein
MQIQEKKPPIINGQQPDKRFSLHLNKQGKLQSVKLEPNACEKANNCEGAVPACFAYEPQPFSIWTCIPKRRWMYCWQWKHKLGMVFDKDLGVYILPEDKEKLMERANK